MLKSFKNKKTLSLFCTVCFFAVFIFSLLYSTVAFAEQGVPSTLSYQGRLADLNGNLLGGDGTSYFFRFSLWDSPTVGNGSRVWPTISPGAVSLNVKQGLFNVVIGDTDNGYPNALDYNFSSNKKVYLQVEVSSNNSSFETLSPRMQITPAAFAQVAGAVSGAGQSSFGTTTPFARSIVTIQSTSSNSTALTVRGSSGQTSNLFNIFDSFNNALFSIGADGGIFSSSSLSVRGPVNFFDTFTAGTSTLGSTHLSSAKIGTLNGILFGNNGDVGSVATSSLGINSDDIVEGVSHVFFTDNKASVSARNALSSVISGLNYSTSTGVFSLDSEHVLPSTLASSNWDTAFSNRITSASGPLSFLNNILSLSQASSTENGYLSSVDWNIFNSKQNALGFIPVANTTTINNHGLSSNISLSASDIGLGNVANVDTTNTSNITDSSNKRFITDTQRSLLQNTSGVNTGDQDLSGYALLSSAHFLGAISASNFSGTSTGQNTGDETQVTIKSKLGAASSDTDGYLTNSDWSLFNAKQNTIATGTTGQYLRGDLSLATFPTSLSNFLNDTGYISTTTVSSEYPTFSYASSTYYLSSNPSGFITSSGSPIQSVFGRVGDVVATNGDYNTSQITENGNLYFTNARAVTALTGQNISLFNNDTGFVTSSAFTPYAKLSDPTQTITALNFVVDGGTSTGFLKGDGSVDSSTYLTSLSGALLATGTTIGATSQYQQFTTGIQGGTGVTSILNLKGTSGNGTLTSPAIQALVGNNGATTAYTVLNNGNVGIGTSTPQSKLHLVGGDFYMDATKGIYGSDDTLNLGMRWSYNNTIYNLLTLGTGGSVFKQLAGSNTFTINAGNGNSGTLLSNNTGSIRFTPATDFIITSGKVGIGTTSPGAKLTIYDVNSNANLFNIVSGATSGFGANFKLDSTAQLGGHQWTFFTGGSNDLSGSLTGGFGFYDNTASKLRLAINATGDVGIGGGITSGTTMTGSNLVIQNGGNVGVGTSTPGYRLNVVSNGTASPIVIQRNLNTDKAMLGFKPAGALSSSNLHWDFGMPDNVSDFAITSWDGSTLTRRLTINTSGNVGIGTTTPLNKFVVQGNAQSNFSFINAMGYSDTSAGGIELTGYFGNKYGMYVDNSGTLKLGYNNSGGSVVSINNAGNISNLSALLNIQNIVNGPTYSFTSDTDTGIYNPAINSLGFSTAGVDRLRVDSSGNVGIGTISPGAKLELYDVASSTIKLSNGTYAATISQGSGYVTKFAASAQLEITAGSQGLAFNGGNTRGSMRLMNNAFITQANVYAFGSGQGKFGFYNYGGDTSYEAIGEVYTDNNNRGLTFFAKSGGTTSEAVRISSVGNVGIGTTSPLAKIQVNTTAITDIGQIIKGIASQSGDLTQWQDSNGNALASLNKDFRMDAKSFSLGGGVQVLGYGTNTLNLGNNSYWTTINYGTASTASNIFNGSIAIGTSTPSAKLDIFDSVLAGSGSLTGSILNLAQTWNTTGAPTALKLNVTNTASAASSLLMDLQLGGTSKFKVRSDGLTTLPSMVVSGFVDMGNAISGVGLTSNARLAWSNSTTNPSVTSSLLLFQDAAGILAQRNGVSSQALRLYNTYTDASNYERAVFDWQTTANVLRIGTEAAGIGTLRNIAFVGGNVGIGTNSPSVPLTVSGSAYVSGTSTASAFQIGGAGSIAALNPSTLGISNKVNILRTVSANAMSVTLPVTNVGDTIIVSFGFEGTLGSTSVVDSCGNSYVKILDKSAASNLSMWYAPISGIGNCSITASAGASSFATIMASEVAGSVLAVDTSSSAVGLSASLNTTTSDFVYSAVRGYHGATTYSAVAPFTLLGLQNGNDAIAAEYYIQSAAGSITASFTGTLTDNSTIGVVGLKMAMTSGDIALAPYGGNVGIGISSPTYKLDTQLVGTGIVASFKNTDAVCTINPSTGLFSCTSDIRLKKNIENISTSTLDQIMALNPVSFNWQNDTDGTQKKYGFIAQEVEKIFPFLVATDENSGYKSLSISGLVPFVVKALQDINVKVDTLASSLKNLVVETISARKVQSDVVCVGQTCIDEATLKSILEKDNVQTLPTSSGNQSSSQNTTVDTGSSTISAVPSASSSPVEPVEASSPSSVDTNSTTSQEIVPIETPDSSATAEPLQNPIPSTPSDTTSQPQ